MSAGAVLSIRCRGGEEFGFSVAVGGTTAAMGAPYTNVQEGAFYLRALR